MFTGLVETVGTVTALEQLDNSSSSGTGTSITISDCADLLTDCQLGDSICVNGTCLTVTKFNPTTASFKVGIAPETLRRTNLGSLTAGSEVNLERSVRASTRMGGHFLQGHVDTTATIISVIPDGNALTFRLRPRDHEALRYIVEKGYVGVDGASLTVTAVEDKEDGWFEFMLIAYTQERIVTAKKTTGNEVNIELDMVGKYVEKAVAAYFDGKAGDQPAILEKMVGKIIDNKLQN